MMKKEDGHWYASGGVRITDATQIAQLEDMAASDRVADSDTVEPSAPAGETKAQAFKRLATARVTIVIKRIQLVGNLHSRASYEYTPEQVAKVFLTIRAEVDAAEALFSPRVADKPLFTLDD